MQVLLERIAILAVGWVTVLDGIMSCFSRLFLEPCSYSSALLSSECACIREMLERLRIRIPVVHRAFKYVSVRYVDWCRRFRFDAADPKHDPARRQHFTVTNKTRNFSLSSEKLTLNPT